MKLPDYGTVHTIIFDFDGIFTDNKVMVDEFGRESVFCSRADGLGIDILRVFVDKNSLDLDFFILSKEKNNVVQKRADKMQLKCHSSINNKLLFIKDYLLKRFGAVKETEKGIIYLGNDLNDLDAMNYAGFSVAPKDSHHKIQEVADMVLNKKGGEGFVREFIEQFLQLDKINYDLKTL